MRLRADSAVPAQAIYRIKGQNELVLSRLLRHAGAGGNVCGSIPFFPYRQRLYNIEDLKPNQH